MGSMIWLRRSRFAPPFALFLTFATLAPLMPRSARADDGSGLVDDQNIPPAGAGFSDGSGNFSANGGTNASAGNATGEATSSYPFELTTARGGAQPSLSLKYSSSTGVGFAGVGWTLDLPSIVRKGVAGLPKFTDDIPTQSNSDDYTIDGQLLLPVSATPSVPAVLPSVSGHPWTLYRREIDDGSRYFFDGLTWVQQTKTGLRQFGTPLDGGTPSVETVGAATGNAFNGALAAATTNDKYIYRWNLVRDSDVSGNTVFYVWDDEHALLGVNPKTAGTMFLTDIYDTANTPNPTPPGPPPLPICTGPSTRSCSNGGTETGTCTNGVWSWGPCQNQGACTPGATQGCGNKGVQSCSVQGQWDPCIDQDCAGSDLQGGCGGVCSVQVGTCNNGTWSWSACQQPLGANCSPPGSQQSCGTGGIQTCSSSCTWGACACTGSGTKSCEVCGTQTGTCNNGSWVWGKCQAPPGGCLPTDPPKQCGATGSGTQTCNASTCTWNPCSTALLDDVLGLFEGTAYAQTSSTSFAHHVHLTWELPIFPAYPTAITTNAGLVGPYAMSPIWKAPPFAQLATVDVFSATGGSSARQLVREYQLKYTRNNTQTLNYLESIQLVGDCDSVGGISETNISPSSVASCASKESYPATTFSYYGIQPSSYQGAPAPTVISETQAYSAPAAADFLVDLNGDAVDDLVAGVDGMKGVESCLEAWNGTNPCGITDGGKLLNALTVGFWAVNNCPCPNGAPVTGPTQTAGTVFSTSNGPLTTYTVDDSMWAFSTFADWGATGRTSFLQTLPPLPLQSPLTEGGGYTNANPGQVFLGQLSDPSSGSTSLQSLMSSLSSTDVSNIQAWITSSSGALQTRKNFAPYNAVDVDGDGLPDMFNLNGDVFTSIQGATQTLISARDRSGNTHPFQMPVVQPTSAWESPSWWWSLPGDLPYSPSWTFAAGTYVAIMHTGGSNPWDAVTKIVAATTAAHAVADIDGDGIADEVIANKFRTDWNQTMGQGFRGNQNDWPDLAWNDGPLSFVGLVVLPGRGDGRFGVPNADAPPANQAGIDDHGNYMTPGATSPFAPYTYPYGGQERPPYGNVGPLPPAQSDSVSPYAMQSSAIRFGDLNGDGLSDYAVLDGAGLHICLRYGGPWDAAHWSCVTRSGYAGNDQSDDMQPHATIMIGDVNGSGINRVIYFPAAAQPYGAPSSAATAVLVSPDGTTSAGPRDGLLKTTSNGFGAQTTFTYASINSLNIGTIPVPAWVVTSATTTNGLTGTQAVENQTSYTYATPIYDARDQMFVGFRSVTATTTNDNSGVFSPGSPGTVTRTTYATQTDATMAGATTPPPEGMVHASRFLPELVEVSENSTAGTRFSTTSYSYTFQQYYTSLDGTSGQGRPGMTLSQRTVATYPWSPGETANTQVLASPLSFGAYSFPQPTVQVPSGGLYTMRQAQFDGNANEVVDQDFGVPGVDVPIMRQLTWGLPTGDGTGWGYRIMQSLTGYTYAGGGTFNPTLGIREQDFVYDSLGRLLRETAPLSGGVALPGPAGGPRAAGQPPTAVLSSSSLIAHAYQYDQFGNVLFSGNQDNACERGVTYDTLFAQLPVTTTYYPNGCGTAGLATSLNVDGRTEKPRSSADPAGRVTLTWYDDFGRVTEVDQPNVQTAGLTTRVLTASYRDVAPVRLVIVSTGYGVDTGATVASGFTSHYRYIDGLGETRAVVDAIDPTTHPGQSWTVSGVHTSYLTGRTAAVYQPMFGSGPSAAGTLPPEVFAPTSASAASYYDGLGRSLVQTDFKGAWSTAVYRDGALSVDSYDAEQTVLPGATGSHKGALTTVTRDGHGRVAKTDAHWVRGPDGTSGDLITTTTYQATGEPTDITQTYPGGYSDRYMTYDSWGRMVTNHEPNSGTWTYAHDAEGRLVGTSDARGCGENIFYDLGGRQLATDYSPCSPLQPAYSAPSVTAGGAIPFAGAEESYAYDPTTGFPSQQADRGRFDVYSYDRAGQLNQITREMSTPGAVPAQYGPQHVLTIDQYTVAGQPAQRSVHSLAVANGGSEVETTSYGVDGQVTQISAAPAPGSLVSGLTYDAAGRTLTASFGRSLKYGTIVETPVAATYGYDSNGALTSYVYSQSTISSTRTTTQTYTNSQLTRDLVGNPLTATDSATAYGPGSRAVNQTYSYSDDYRLQKVTSMPASGSPDTWLDPYAYEQSINSPLYPQPTPEANRFTQISSSYDWRGNPLQQSDLPANNDFFDRSLGLVTKASGTDQISRAATGTNSLQAAYDVAGNLTSLTVGESTATQYTYTWDELGNLASAARVGSNGQETETYTYAAGSDRTNIRRTGASGPAAYTTFVFDMLVLKNGSSATQDDLTTEQVYLADGLARLFNDPTITAGQATTTGGVAGNHTFLNLPDPRGSGAFVVDVGTASLVERTSYMPYGGLDTDYRVYASREDVKFDGHWDNAEVGLTYFGKRYYSPQLGRFISPDPLTVHGVSGDPNPYEFAFGNPIRFTDPTGLDGVADAGATAGAPAATSESGGADPTPADGEAQQKDVNQKLLDNATPPGQKSVTPPQQGVSGASSTSPVSVSAGTPPTCGAYHGSCANLVAKTGSRVLRDGAIITVGLVLDPAQATVPFLRNVGTLASPASSRTEKGFAALGIAAPFVVMGAGAVGSKVFTSFGQAVDLAAGAVEGADAVVQDAATTGVQANRAAGNAFRDEIARVLQNAGRDVDTEVFKRTPFGKRFIDIEVSQDGKILGGVETKLRTSPYTPSQRAKDAWLWLMNGYRVNVVRGP